MRTEPIVIDGRHFRNDKNSNYRNGKRIRTRKIHKFHRLWFRFERFLERELNRELNGIHGAILGVLFAFGFVACLFV